MSKKKETKEVGDVAALRNALESVLAEIGEHADNGMEVVWCGIKGKTIRKCRAALAKPPRQCDVGTAYEQSERFMSYCFAKKHCEECSAHKQAEKGVLCHLFWAQLPHEATAEEGDSNA